VTSEASHSQAGAGSGGAEPPASRPVLRIEDLGVSFNNGSGPRVRAVDGASMAIHPGQTLAVVGESGCGKSVTAMSALQLVPRPPGRFDRGAIRYRTSEELGWGEVDLTRLDTARIRRIRGNEIAMIFQEPMNSLNPVYTVGEQVIEPIRLHQRVARRRARAIAVEAMRDVGIPEPESRVDAYPHEFSGGMRQRVMIAMALACQPRVLLADEPTTALDVTIQSQILELLAGLRRAREMAIMLITHDLGVVAQNADVVCVMYAGRVVEYAAVYELFERPLHPYTRGLLASIPRLHRRSPRLTTIDEIVGDRAQFERLPGADEGIRPWWPWHDPPAGMAAPGEARQDSTLVEILPDHWVGVWSTESAASGRPRAPDLAFAGGPASVA